jgi:hypothetical protein
LVDEKAKVAAPTPELLARLQDYQRWLLHACAASPLPWEEEDRDSMLSPTKHRGLSLTHQLLAVIVLRQRGRLDRNVDALIDTLCERIGAEETWRLCVNDLYIQRVASLLMAGRPDLVKPRWVERILVWQQEDGGWKYVGYSWSPALEFDLRGQRPNAHTTVQGVWLLYMLKYRYPQWIANNCGY